mmetsp:Transcript_23954/g.23623  ORF Transcript_23954/g.23623 Transcript_23954/m.23623 type:complete len:115 (+) Transcript_23954:11-355(+)
MSMTMDQLRLWSRKLHNKAPSNPYYQEKIPKKTILLSFIFFVVGSIFLYLGVDRVLNPVEGEGEASPWEFFILGFILFIPGSYHTFIALMACRKVEGYTYDQVCVFDEDYGHDD